MLFAPTLQSRYSGSNPSPQAANYFARWLLVCGSVSLHCQRPLNAEGFVFASISTAHSYLSQWRFFGLWRSSLDRWR